MNHVFPSQLAEKYGNVFSLRRGTTKIVYVSGYKMVKEALVTQGESFARYISPLFDEIYKGRGISISRGLPNIYIYIILPSFFPLDPYNLFFFCSESLIMG